MIYTSQGERIAIAYKEQLISYNEMQSNIFSFATLLEGKKTERVAIFAENLPEWIMAFYASWQHDITVVPIDFMASAEDVAYILNDCEPGFVFHSKNTENVLNEALKSTSHDIDTFCFGSQELPKATGEIYQPTDVDKTAVIIYTSGTTGSPKGVMLSYDNLTTNVKAVCNDIPIYELNARVLLILPLQHIFPLVGAMMAPLMVGGMVAIAPSLQAADIIDTLKTHKLTHIIGVPRLYELIYKGVINKINASPATANIYKVVKAINSPKLGKKVFKKVHEGFGGHLKFLVSGGAALPTEVGGFYNLLGFEVLEGYGMTEASPMISFTHPGDVIIGCAGKTMPCLEVEIRDNEVVAKGKSIMKGYYNRPEETAEVLRDGWLYTGDLGRISDGRLYITGRKKEIIILSNGKNINPNSIEESIVKMANNTIIEVGVTQHEDILHAVILPNFKELSNQNVQDATAFFNNFLLQEYNPNVTPYKQVNKCTLVKEDLPRTRLSKLQRFKLNEIIENGETKKERAPEPTTKEYLSVKKFIEDLIGKDVYADSHLAFDLGLDSLAKLELIDYIERTFGLTIQEEELLNYTSFGSLVEFISGHKQHFNEDEFDWHEMMTQPLDMDYSKPWWTLTAINFKARLLFKSFFKLTQIGSSQYPEGAGIIAPNHASFFDGFLVSSLLKRSTLKDTFFYAKKAHINTPFRRMMAKHNNVIIMDLEKDLYKSIQQLAQLLRDGKKLILFPEGTRSRDGQLGEFKKTFAILCKELNVPVYPVAIKGAFESWPRHKKFPILGTPITVSYLDAILPDGLDEIEIADNVKSAIQQELNK